MTSALVWFRQDLRLNDNSAFIAACTQHQFVIPIYILDVETTALGEAQAWWLHYSLAALSKSLNQLGLKLILLKKGTPLEIILKLAKDVSADSVYWNRCYEPTAISRDKKIKAALLERGIEVHSSNGSLLNEPWTIKNKTGGFFKVFTPYWKHCRQLLPIHPAMSLANRPKAIDIKSDALEEWKLLPTIDWAKQFPDYWTPGEEGAQNKLDEFIKHHLNGYKINRDFPAKNATSRLSPHLHFGEISPWTVLRALELAKLDPECDIRSVEHFLSELGWREFSTYLLYHFPTLAHENFRNEFDAFPWQNDSDLLKLWQKGMTGYPIIDAGMRELWATGFMHNRVRMIVASFLTKGLFVDWRLGAAWFSDTLVDADLANNSSGWQWVAGCGIDASPYFRIFNPVLQSQKFDSEGAYIRKWVPELSTIKNQSIHAPWDAVDSNRIYLNTKYPPPIIDHSESRIRALEYYKQLKQKKDVL